MGGGGEHSLRHCEGGRKDGDRGEEEGWVMGYGGASEW